MWFVMYVFCLYCTVYISNYDNINRNKIQVEITTANLKNQTFYCKESLTNQRSVNLLKIEFQSSNYVPAYDSIYLRSQL